MGQSNLPNKILVIDDDPAISQGVENGMSKHGVKTLKATNYETALYQFNQNRFDVVLVELDFEELPGMVMIQKWRKHDVQEKCCTGFILLSGSKRKAIDENLMRELGDIEVIQKPFSDIQLLPYLARAKAAKQRALSYYELKSNILSHYEKSGNFEKAATQVQKNLPGLGSRGLNMLYDLYEKAEKFDDALAIVDGLLAKNNNDISLINAKGRLLMRLGRNSEARKYMERADELAPQNIDRLNSMAAMYIALQEPGKSVDKFREILKLSPDEPALKFDMFSKLYDAGFDEHATEFGKETTKPMEIVRHYNNKGVMLSKDGDVEMALTDYHRALKFFPKFKENYRIYFNIALAKVNMRTKEAFEEAKTALETCLELSPEFEKAKNLLEQVNKSLGVDKDKAG